MYKLGELQEMEIKRIVPQGAYVNTRGAKDRDDILLPKKELMAADSVGTQHLLFVYKDGENRPVATKRRPFITLGKLAMLKVVDTSSIGAFMDWGMEKDLFLPFKEQTEKLHVDRYYLVALYIDKSDRLCATMRVANYLKQNSPYKEKDWVEGTIYNINPNYGLFVAVDNVFEGRVRKESMRGAYAVGEKIKLRVARVREDGRLDLTPREAVPQEMETDAQLILNALKLNNGYLPVNDRSSPEEIYNRFNMSKASFKRGVGRLLKNRLIRFSDGGIELTKRRKHGK